MGIQATDPSGCGITTSSAGPLPNLPAPRSVRRQTNGPRCHRRLRHSQSERKRSDAGVARPSYLAADITHAILDGWRPRDPHCQINVDRAEVTSGGARDHAAVTAFLHWFAASARRIRSVERETRWRWRLKVLWTAACMLRNRWAEQADLNRCNLRSRRRTA